MFQPQGGHVMGPGTRATVAWMDEERRAGSLMDMDWLEFNPTLMTKEELAAVEEVFAAFFLCHTKAELYEKAIERSLFLAPVNTIGEVLADRQLRSRDFFVELEHPELGVTLTYPGPFVKATETEPVVRFRAPLIGEHNEEVYVGELGFSREELADLKARGVI